MTPADSAYDTYPALCARDDAEREWRKLEAEHAEAFHAVEAAEEVLREARDRSLAAYTKAMRAYAAYGSAAIAYAEAWNVAAAAERTAYAASSQADSV